MRVQFARIYRKVVTITRGRWMEDLHANCRLNPKPATLIERNFIEPKTSGLRCINVCVVKRDRFGWLSWVIEASSNRILIELSNNGMSRTAKRLILNSSRCESGRNEGFGGTWSCEFFVVREQRRGEFWKFAKVVGNVVKLHLVGMFHFNLFRIISRGVVDGSDILMGNYLTSLIEITWQGNEMHHRKGNWTV